MGAASAVDSISDQTVHQGKVECLRLAQHHLMQIDLDNRLTILTEMANSLNSDKYSSTLSYHTLTILQIECSSLNDSACRIEYMYKYCIKHIGLG